MHTYFLSDGGDRAAIIEFASVGAVSYRTDGGPAASISRDTAALYLWRARERGWSIKRWR